MDDLISRQGAIKALAENMPSTYTPDGSHPADEGIFMVQEIYADCIQTLKELPSAQPEMNMDEWCTDCKEYDHERHCCPRYNRIIREALAEAREAPSVEPKKGKWVDEMGNRKTSGYCATCTACGEWSEYITDYCPNCGAKMEGETDEDQD